MNEVQEIKAYMKRTGLKPENLARLTGVSTPTIYRIVKHGKPGLYSTMNKILTFVRSRGEVQDA